MPIIRKWFISLCTDCLTITRTTPHSRSTPWVESKANRYTADQSPLSDGRTNTLEYFLTQTEERVPVYHLILTFKNIYLLKLASD